ncbi:MAG TPA: hypothetical protein VMM35_08715 [Longimicrobiales bacterium]|nr:hypothetical protein [Longimicrobiales bacterium]
MSADAGALTVARQQADILASLRRLRGRATVGDVAADTGLPNDAARQGLKALLESHRGHLAVSDSGELLYEFDPRLIERGTEPLLARLSRSAGKLLRGAFKAWIVVMLVGYFVVFVVLVIAALFASQRGGGNSRGGWSRGRRHGGLPIPNFWLWYLIWSPRWRIGRPYYGHRWERTLDKDDRVPFYKKVFAFVFGPDRPQPTQRQLDRGTIRLIRARGGVLTTADLMEHTALTYPEAEAEMGRLLGAYDGEAAVSPEGELAYAFPALTTSAQGEGRPRQPNPAWLRLERELELTGNTAGANAAVAGMNGFTLLAGATAPWFIFPRLGLGGPAAFVGLVLVPVVFSVLFFGIPLARMVAVKLENRRRHERNVRRVLLGLVYQRTLEQRASLGVEEAHRHVASRLSDRSVARSLVERALHDLAAELDAEVAADEAGALRFSFPALRQEVMAGEAMRRKLRLDERTLGPVVFSTSDTPEEADRRDQELFDRALTESEADLGRYVPSLERVAYEDDYELVAFDQELAATSLPRR